MISILKNGDDWTEVISKLHILSELYDFFFNMTNLNNIFNFRQSRLLYLLVILSFIQYSCRDKSSKYIPVTKENVDDVFTSTESIDDNNFVGNENCKECHIKEFETWKGSDHDNSMQVANRKTILAKFEGERFKSQGIISRFFQKEDGFYVNTEGPDGSYQDYKIVYVFGITPLQQYIVSFPKGRYQCLRTAWDTKKNEWFDLYPDFKIVHSEWLHWSRGGDELEQYVFGLPLDKCPKKL